MVGINVKIRCKNFTISKNITTEAIVSYKEHICVEMEASGIAFQLNNQTFRSGIVSDQSAV